MKALTSVEEFNTVKASSKVLVDFWAPWCGPCKALIPVLESMEDLHQDTVFVKVNADDAWASDLVNSFGITSLPTLILFKNGQMDGRLVGAASRAKISGLLS